MSKQKWLGVGTGVLIAGVWAFTACKDTIDVDKPLPITVANGGGAGVGGTDTEGGPGGASGTAGATGGAGGLTPPGVCHPRDVPACFVAGPDGPGSECLAVRDNAGKDRVQFRSTWARTIAPAGNADDLIYSILKSRSQINQPDCHMSMGTGGFILLTDWDRSNPTITEQIVRTGYSTYSNLPTAIDPTTVIRDGLCFAEYDFTTDLQGPLALPPGRGKPLPWHAAPVPAKRVAADFNVADMIGKLKEGEGIAYIDETAGTIHGYSPLGFVSVLDNRSGGLTIPIRETEIKVKFNNGTFNCAGRFRSDVMTPDTSCDSSDQKNPQWGCTNDSACPPPGFGTETGPGTGPVYIEGYFLITELEQVYSNVLQATLCVTYPGQQRSIDEGWAVRGNSGLTCRNSPKWNPALPDDAGLPPGDWCSKTNSKATMTCHDAYHSLTYGAAQAFNIKEATCPLEPPAQQ